MSNYKVNRPNRIQSSIESLLKDEAIINLKPPYQRKACWEDSYKAKLIDSIINNIPVNAIHLVKESMIQGGEKFIALDGKQRLSTIFRFVKNDFKVKIKFSNYEEKEFNYTELVTLSNLDGEPRKEQARKILRDFSRYSVDTMEWPEMSILEQSVIFDRINYSKELSKEERLLSNYFYAKMFVEHVMQNYISNLTARSRFKDDMRSKDLVWGLRILYIFFNGVAGLQEGASIVPSMNKIYNSQYKSGLSGFAKILHERIQCYVNDNKNEILNDISSEDEMKKMIKSFKWDNKFKELFKFVDEIGKDLFIRSSSKPHEQINAWTLLYLTAFVLEKVSNKELTYNEFSSNKKDFNNLTIQYLNWVGADENLTRRHMQKAVFLDHKKKMQELFDKLPLNHGRKSSYISSSAKAKALLTADNKCEVIGCESTEDLQFDHVSPSSLYPQGKIGILCRKHNRQKNDNTLDTLDEIRDYIEQKIA